MDAFAWNALYTTGLDSVDEQHRKLVGIINRLGTLRAESRSPEALETIFRLLVDYANFHFHDEEQLMAEAGVDPAHQEAHRLHHRQFLEQVSAMKRSLAAMAQPVETLHTFLSSWLAFHILGEDQAMAREIAHIQSGLTPAQAHQREAAPADPATAALLKALHRLYAVISTQNQDLASANLALEEKVEARTRELSAANEQLRREQDELHQLFTKVEEAQSQLLQAEKMASIGQLAAGVAHEINNPIGYVNSNLGVLRDDVERLLTLLDAYETVAPHLPAADAQTVAAARRAADLDYLREDIPALLTESAEGIERVRRIVQDLKDFSHVDEAEWQLADLNAGLDSTLNVVWNELKYKARVEREYGQLPRVRCIPAQINQVTMNLLVNAVQAIDGQGVITLRSGLDGDFAWYEVSDTGRGMAPEVARRVFEPFFTTKPVGKGTGLGLSISWDIVRKHGGDILVNSIPGQGTTFRVRLPLAGPAPDEPARSGTASVP